MATANPTALYRHYNKDGTLLYVGISLSAVGRLGQHKRNAEWFWSIRRIEVEYFPSRGAASLDQSLPQARQRPASGVASVRRKLPGL
jgi:hypothetical protein